MSHKIFSILFATLLVAGCGVVGEISSTESIATGDRSAGMERGKMSASECRDRDGYKCTADTQRNVCECEKDRPVFANCSQLPQFDCEEKRGWTHWPRCECTRPLENRGAPGVHCWSNSDCASNRCRTTSGCYKINGQLFERGKTCTVGGGTVGELPNGASASICPSARLPHGSPCYGDGTECTTGVCKSKCFLLKSDPTIYKLGACIHQWQSVGFDFVAFFQGANSMMNIPNFDKFIDCNSSPRHYTGGGSSNNTGGSAGSGAGSGSGSGSDKLSGGTNCSSDGQCSSGYCGCFKDAASPDHRRKCLGGAPATRGDEYWTGTSGNKCTNNSRKGVGQSCSSSGGCMSNNCGREACGAAKVCLESGASSAPATCPSSSGSSSSGLAYWAECSYDGQCGSNKCGCFKNSRNPSYKRRCLTSSPSATYWTGTAANKCTSSSRKGVGDSCSYDWNCMSHNCGREACGGAKVCLTAGTQSAAQTCSSGGSSSGGSSSTTTTCAINECPTSAAKATTTAGTFSVNGCATQGTAAVGFDNKCYVCGSGAFDGWTLVSSGVHNASSCAQLVYSQGSGSSSGGSSSGGSSSGGSYGGSVTCPPGFTTGHPAPQIATPIYLGANIAGSTPCNHACWGSGYAYNVCTTTGGGVGWQFCLPSGVFASCAAR